MNVLTVDIFKKQWHLGKKWGILQVLKKRKERKNVFPLYQANNLILYSTFLSFSWLLPRMNECMKEKSRPYQWLQSFST